MSTGSAKIQRRERAIEATRRRVQLLEIEMRRVKAELARLEADHQDDLADRLTRKLRRRGSVPSIVAEESAQVFPVPPARSSGKDEPAVLAFSISPHATTLVETSKEPKRDRALKRSAATSSRSAASTLSNPVAKPDAKPVPVLPLKQPDERNQLKKSGKTKASPLVFSLAVHAVALSLCFTFSFATIVQNAIPLFASPSEIDETEVAEFSEVEIEATKFDDVELQNVVHDQEEFNIADNLSREFAPTELGAGHQPLGDLGQLDAIPSDLGALMAGGGDPGSGKAGGPAGEAVFFGARSQGNRFVFVVDNSSSMKSGRLESATAELLRTVEGLRPSQGFYVIFVSDEVYPMFYPTPAPDLIAATPTNKKRLAEWLPNAILASGNNRKMIDAMNMAAELRPDSVFLLWDGDLKYSDKVRMDVMTHLTRPNQWSFTIHTLGMGTNSLDAQFNLESIAKAHNGTFRRVDVPAARAK